MPTRALHMRKIRELVRLKYEARLSHEQIAGALAISKGVVAKYVARIERTGLEPAAVMSMRRFLAPLPRIMKILAATIQQQTPLPPWPTKKTSAHQTF